MGEYVNPEDMTKEQWLEEHGEKKSHTTSFADCPDTRFPVMLVDNGPFTAAGIAYDEREFKAFTLPDDYRPKQLYFVDKDELKQFMSASTLERLGLN